MELWTPNQTLKNGRFIVQKVLGGGGFGVTYSVLEQRTHKLFAIKTLNPIQQSQGNFNDSCLNIKIATPNSRTVVSFSL
jgi:serine/threonine protein kinase